MGIKAERGKVNWATSKPDGEGPTKKLGRAATPEGDGEVPHGGGRESHTKVEEGDPHRGGEKRET